MAVLVISPTVIFARSKTQTADNPKDLVWPLPPDKPRVRFLTMYSNNFDIEPRQKRSWVDKLVGAPDPNKAVYFEKAAGVATDSKGRILIASLQLSSVFILDVKQHTVTQLRGDRGIMFISPLGLAVDNHDNFYVSDPMLHMVMKFDSGGHMLATVGADAGMKNPTFMAIDEARRRLYVVDSHLHQVLVYNLDGLNLIHRVGKRGGKNGEFNFPVGIGVNRQGDFAVSDTGSCSVQVFSPDYKFTRRIGHQGTQPGTFVRPKGVAFDSEGNLWVADAAFNNFQIFNSKGQILMFIGNLGNVPGAFNLPEDIYIDKDNRVYVTDQLNARVQIFQFLGGE
jgi:DNA-binding beta-propeller fold protein YncE